MKVYKIKKLNNKYLIMRKYKNKKILHFIQLFNITLFV